MLLAIDVGNTNTVLGVFDLAPHRTALRDSFRVQTEKDRTATSTGCSSRRSSTSPASRCRSARRDRLERGAADGLSARADVEALLRQEAALRRPGVRTGMPVLYDNPREVGADRIVNAVAAWEKCRAG